MNDPPGSAVFCLEDVDTAVFHVVKRLPQTADHQSVTAHCRGDQEQTEEVTKDDEKYY